MILIDSSVNDFEQPLRSRPRRFWKPKTAAREDLRIVSKEA